MFSRLRVCDHFLVKEVHTGYLVYHTRRGSTTSGKAGGIKETTVRDNPSVLEEDEVLKIMRSDSESESDCIIVANSRVMQSQESRNSCCATPWFTHKS